MYVAVPRNVTLMLLLFDVAWTLAQLQYMTHPGSQLLQLLILVFLCRLRMYHYIEGESFLKLYVLFNMLDPRQQPHVLQDQVASHGVECACKQGNV